ncbi:MAG: 3-hydroxyacyl-CoA dehydrogenase family protein [candidate division WOR-3 bacterium]
MKADDIKKVGVVGAGTMGNGIAHVFALKGYDVVLVDISKDILDKAIATITGNLDRQVKKEIIKPEDRDAALARIKTSTDLSELKDCQLVVEAIVEKEDIKTDLFKKLDSILGPEAILASNTSSISINKLAAATGRPGKVAGMHFMNPVPMMKLVELVRGKDTSDETMAVIKELSERLEKVPAIVNDSPGFVSNRVLMPMINEAAHVLMEGVAEPEAIDTVMKVGMNHPMGPLTLADLIGLDVVVDILNYIHKEKGDPKFKPAQILVDKVKAGELGRKTGKGFYTYQ